MSAEKPLAGKTVLLVDDEQFNILAMTRLLASWGCEVLVADNGNEAMEQLNEHAAQVDIVLMDIMMPEKDGYQTMQEIRAENRYQNLLIVALTANAMKGDMEKCLAVGATDYMSKPIDPSALKALMLKHLLGQEAGV